MFKEVRTVIFICYYVKQNSLKTNGEIIKSADSKQSVGTFVKIRSFYFALNFITFFVMALSVRQRNKQEKVITIYLTEKNVMIKIMTDEYLGVFNYPDSLT